MTLQHGPAWLFCPADRPERFAKAAAVADVVILDMHAEAVQVVARLHHHVEQVRHRGALVAADVGHARLQQRLGHREDAFPVELFAGAEAQVQLYAPLATAGGRKRLQGRLLEVGGTAGNERVRLELAPEGTTKSLTPGRGRVASKKAGGKAAGRKVEAAGVVVEFSLAEVDKAKLVPELNFRGGSKE